MIGGKTIAAVALGGAAIGHAAWTGQLEPVHLATLAPASCFAIGLFAGLAAALIGVGWKPRLPSRLALGWRDRRVVFEATAVPPRDLPYALQRALMIAAFACVGLGVFTNAATARLTTLPAAVVTPSAGEYCPPEVTATDEPEAPPPPVEIPGCALVKRAFALGYAKSLGSCAPQEAPPSVEAARAAAEPCWLRQRDEPYLYYSWRKLAAVAGGVSETNPIEAIEHGIEQLRIQLDHVESLVAAQHHAVVGTRHASHHVWITLPDPRPRTWWQDLIEPETCDDRYAALPLWPATGTTPAALVEQVLGQLLFATRFGTPASCGDHDVHWGAAASTCAELIADPTGYLGHHGQLDALREALDRRRRQLELRALATRLGRRSPPEPPRARTIVSFACVVIDPAATAVATTGRDVSIDGEAVSVREIRMPAPRTTGTGVLDLYARLATLFAGDGIGPAVVDASAGASAPGPAELAHADFVLTRLDLLHDTDPFAATAWPLDRPELVEIYPLHRQLRTFVDAFRRRYHAQRGRL